MESKVNQSTTFFGLHNVGKKVGNSYFNRIMNFTPG